MEEHFEKFISNISLTVNQRKDAITKYEGVCKSLNKEFYDSDYSDNVKFLFGSYKKKTTISHSSKDVDVIFKIPKEVFAKYQSQENGPSNLLTRVKNTLKETYPTTENIKNWTKVVLVDFQSFKVEVVPALEQENGKFTIPNSGNGEDWLTDFDPRSEIDDFFHSNNTTNKLTRKLIKIIKKWKLEKSNINIKTYIIDKHVISFLDGYVFTDYPKLICDFFSYLHKIENQTYTETALNQSEKAFNFYTSGEVDNAAEEYKKIFGDEFPKNINKSIFNTEYETAPNEQFIENLFEVSIDQSITLDINVFCKPEKGSFRSWIPMKNFPFYGLNKRERLEFVVVSNCREPFETKWKVRNFGVEAAKDNRLRGEILEDSELHKYIDFTAFYGEHFIECYLLKNNICVARKKIKIPVNNISI